MNRLNPGDTFPDLDVNLVGGETLSLPFDLAGSYGVLIFNRGAWCPFCTGQLRGFGRLREKLAEIGARVVSLSVDDEDTTRALVEKHRLGFPVGHSADADAIAAATGAFVNPEPRFLQATGFVLDPEGKVIVSSYSSGAIGRLVAEDTVGLISHLQSQAS